MQGMMLKLKLQYIGHLMQRVDSLEKTLMLGGIGDWKKSYDQPRLLSRLKSRDVTLPTKVCLVKTVVFPVVMYGCES